MLTLPSKGRRVEKSPFSKTLLIQESALIWILTVSFIVLAFLCVLKNYTGSLPWLAVTLTGAWTAYGVSQAAYYSKSKAENTEGGIVYDAAIKPLVAQLNKDQDCD